MLSSFVVLIELVTLFEEIIKRKMDYLNHFL